jgi:hypothetical protein
LSYKSSRKNIKISKIQGHNNLRLIQKGSSSAEKIIFSAIYFHKFPVIDSSK